jgi:hypothetical protein
MLISPARRGVAFSTAFDSAVRLCVEAQQLLARSTEILARARSQRALVRQRRQIARDANAHLAATGVLFDVLRREVEQSTDRLRHDGLGEEETLEIVRARVRSAAGGRAGGGAGGRLGATPLPRGLSERTRRHNRRSTR